MKWGAIYYLLVCYWYLYLVGNSPNADVSLATTRSFYIFHIYGLHTTTAAGKYVTTFVHPQRFSIMACLIGIHGQW